MRAKIWGAGLVVAGTMLVGAASMAQEAGQKAESRPPGGTLVADKASAEGASRGEDTDFTESTKIKDAKTPEGVNTTSAATAERPAGKWSGSIESRNEFVASTVNQGNQNYGVAHDTMLWTRLNYGVNPNLRLTAGFDFDHNFFGSDTTAEQHYINTYDNDPFLGFTIPTLAKLPYDISLSLAGRVYVPVSGNSIAAGQEALRAYGILSKDIGKWSVSYLFIPRPYINTKTVYTYVNPDGSTINLRTYAFRMTQIFEVSYKFNDHFSVYQDLGVDDVTYNGGNLNGVNYGGQELSREVIETAMNYTPNDTYRITAGLSSYEHDYRTEGLTFYGPETRYFVSGAANFK